MRAWASIRWRRKTWRLAPWISLRAAAVSLLVVSTAALLLDHWILAGLEQRGLIATDGWKRHNQVVIANHEKKDLQIPYEREKPAGPCGVRSWRGHEVEARKSTSHRVLVMGDSFVWGSPYLTLNHMWWRQLAIELKRRGYNDVEIIAAGCSGMSTHDELDLARKVVPDFQPDLILWGFVTNDPDEQLVKQIHNSQLALPVPGRLQVWLQRLIPRLWELFKTRRADKLAKSYIGEEYGYEYSDWLQRIHDGENFARYTRTVADVSRFLSEIQVPGLLVTLPEAPIKSRFEFSYQKVLPLWRESGIPVLDTLDAFIRQFPDVESTGSQALVWGINPADGHPGPRSSAFLAKQTADRLEQDYPDVLGPRTSRRAPLRINDWLPYDLNVRALSHEGEWELTYPPTAEFLPTMPLGIPTVLVALAEPQPVKSISLSGAGLKSARIWISTYDPTEHYDSQDWQDLGDATGTELDWVVPPDVAQRDTSVIMIQADLPPNDRGLTLRIIPGDDVRTQPKGD